MTEIRKADPTARRQAVLVLVVGICVGAVLIAAFERYRGLLSDWVLADPGDPVQRARLIIVLAGILLVAPVLGIAGYLWSVGGRIVHTREFPPPGLRVIRDTPIITGERAVARGRLLKVLALGLGIVSALLLLLLWRLESVLGTSLHG